MFLLIFEIKTSRVFVKVIDNVVEKCPKTKELIENNMKEVCEGESITVEEVIYFVGFVL